MKVILLTLLICCHSLPHLVYHSFENSNASKGVKYSISGSEKDSLDAFIDDNYPDSIPGIELLVVKNNTILYHKSAGVCNYDQQIPLEKNLIFEIGSVTKLFTAVGVLKLVDEGRLSLEDPLSKFYPGFPESNNIKVKHLLSHTTGITDYAIHFMEQNLEQHFNEGFSKENYFQEIKKDTILQHLKSNYQKVDPGSKWSYSNGGYYFLGLIIEKVT